MTALCEITICVVCQEWEGRRRSVHGTSITPLIPPLAGYRGEDCSSSVNQCVSNPCDPEGTLLCEELANTSRCVCQHGYTGRRCATPISRCVDGLCQHGSACVGLPGGFRCDCLPGRRAIQRGVILFFYFYFLKFQMKAIPRMNHARGRHSPSLTLLLVLLPSSRESNLFGLKQRHKTTLRDVKVGAQFSGL